MIAGVTGEPSKYHYSMQSFFDPFVCGYIPVARILDLSGVRDYFRIGGAYRLVGWLLGKKLNESAPFGAFLDPVADKLIVVSALVILIAQHASVWLTILA